MTAHPATGADGRGGFDVHAHWFGTDLVVEAAYADDRWPRLVVDSSEHGRLMLGNRHFRDVTTTLWDVEHRLADLDAAGIDTQVLSPVPITLAPWAARDQAVAYARSVNISIGAATAVGDGRLLGLGAVPLPFVRESVAVLEQLMTGDDRMLGVQIGARVGDMELDDERLLPFFEAAEALGASLLVHPVEGGGGSVRRSGQPYDFGLGMLTDTALAAGALVFGGVLERFPGLRVALAHGCGGFAWAYPRMRAGAGIFAAADPARLDTLVSRLWVDSLVFDPEHLRLLVHRFGPDRIVLGTDHPFFPSVTSQARVFLQGAGGPAPLPQGVADAVFSRNGAVWAGRAPVRDRVAGR